MCQGSVKSLALYVNAETCDAMSESCTKTNHSDGYNKLPCCTNLSFSTPISLYETVQFVKPDLSLSDIPVEFIDVANISTWKACSKALAVKDDPPDIQLIDAQGMYQVYLI